MRERIPPPDFEPDRQERWGEPEASKKDKNKGMSKRKFLQGVGAFVAHAPIAGALGLESILRLPDLENWDAERSNRMRFDHWNDFSPKQREEIIENEVNTIGSFIRSREGRRILNEGTDDELFKLIISLPPILREHIQDTKFDVPSENWSSVAVGRRFIDGAPETQTLKHGPQAIGDFYSGNGFFIEPDVFLTNWHVVEYSMSDQAQGVPRDTTRRLLEVQYGTTGQADVIAMRVPRNARGIKQSPVLPFDSNLRNKDIAGRLVRTVGIDPDKSAGPDGTKIYASVALPVTPRLEKFFERYGPGTGVDDFVCIRPPGEGLARRWPSPSGSLALDLLVSGKAPPRYRRAQGTSGSPIILENGLVAGINRAGGPMFYKDGTCIELGFFHSTERISKTLARGMVYDIPTPAKKTDRLDVARDNRGSDYSSDDYGSSYSQNY